MFFNNIHDVLYGWRSIIFILNYKLINVIYFLLSNVKELQNETSAGTIIYCMIVSTVIQANTFNFTKLYRFQIYYALGLYANPSS